MQLPEGRRMAKLMLTGLAGAALLVPALLQTHAGWAALVWVTGRARGCGLRQCLDEVEPKILAAMGKIRATSIVLDRDEAGFELRRSASGDFWTPKGNALEFNLGEMELDIYGVKERLKEGDVVLDCGANVGTFIRHALKARAGKVVAFEIDPRNVECLRRTFRQEIAEGRVVVVPQGVWREEGELEVKLYSNTNLNSAVMAERTETSERPRVVKLPVTTIDRAVRELGLNRVDFLKMDVEGAESEALWGARETLKKFRPQLSVASENEPDDIDQIEAVLRQIEPAYRLQSGPCRRIRKFIIRPEVLYGSVDGGWRR